MFFLMMSVTIHAQFINNGATVTIQSGATLRIETDFINNSGTVTNNGVLEVKEDFTNAAAATFTSAVGSTVKFIGDTPSTVTSNGDAFHHVSMEKTAQNITLADAMSVAGTLTFTEDNNKVILGANNLTIQEGGSIASADDNEYVVTDGAGLLVKKVTSDGTYIFPIGDDISDYSPLSLNYTGSYGANANIGAKVIDAVHPNINNPSTSNAHLSRYWHVDGSNITGYNASYTGTYVSGDAIGTASLIEGATYESSTWNHTMSSTNGSSTVTGSSSLLPVDFTGRDKINIILNLTAYIEGFMNAGNTAMVPVLQNSGVSGATSTQCDTVTVRLHNTSAPYAMAHSFTGVIGTNGTIQCTYPATANGNNYYVVVKHRNSLETWSAAPHTITSSSSYTFASALTQAYGSNMVLKGSLAAMYSGDIDSDGEVSASDYTIWLSSSLNGDIGYFVSDLDGDGEVSASDYTIWLNNSLLGALISTP